MKFDVVIGNPPFQSEKRQKKIYTDFIVVSIDKLVKENGYVALITPPNWLSPQLKEELNYFELVNKNNFLYLDISDIKRKFFNNVGSSFCWFLVQKSNNNNELTEIKTDNDTIKLDINNLKYLILTSDQIKISIGKKALNMDKKLYSSTDGRGNAICANTPIVSGVGIGGGLLLTDLGKIGSNSSLKKVVINGYGHKKAIYDNGVYCTNQTQPYIEVASEVEGLNLVNYLHSKLIQFLMNDILTFGNANTKIANINQLPSLDFTKSYTDQDLYKIFNLTEEEIKVIEAFNPTWIKDDMIIDTRDLK